MINRDDWMAALKAAVDAPIPPSDALTVQEFGALVGYEISHARKRLKTMVEKGKAETTKKQIRRSDGSVCWVPAYRLVKPAVTHPSTSVFKPTQNGNTRTRNGNKR